MSSAEGGSTLPRSAALSDAGPHDAGTEPGQLDGGGAEDAGSETAPIAAKETGALRSLRARANDDTVCVIATDQGQRYALYVRDELPEAIARTWLSIP